jgi:hypothetical protein
MTLSAPMRCSALAEQLNEPLAGTVDQRRRWLLIEDRSAWGTDAVAKLIGPDEAALAKRLGVRVQLVRQREGDPAADVVRRVILVDTVTREMAVRTVASVGELSVEAVASVPIAAFGAAMTDPVFLVCTNGKRDACCALRGRALVGVLAGALADEHGDRIWECTHLGGHRFAGNLVCLPDGIVYGRVTAADGPRLAADYLAGRLDPAFLRGRSAWPAPAQVAEVELRRERGLHGLGEVALVAVKVSGDRATVTLATPDGVTHRLELVAEATEPPRPTSCRGDELEQPVHWSVVGAG